MRLLRSTVLVLVVFGGAPCAAYGQEADPARGTGVSVTIGLTWDFVLFGDDNPLLHRELGWTIGGQVWHQTSESNALVFEAAFQINRLENPHFDEAFRSLYLLFGVQLGKPSYIRPGGGLAVHFWEARGERGPTSVAIALGLAGGHENPVGDSFQISAEGTLRLSLEHGVGGAQLGFQVPAGWISRPG